MGASLGAGATGARGTRVPDRRGLPIIVVIAVGVVVLSGLVVFVALFGYHRAMWTLHATDGLLRIGESMAFAGCALSVLSAALTRPPLGYRGFMASLSAAITSAFILGMVVWWHATPTHHG
jgi:hypothetical protein